MASDNILAHLRRLHDKDHLSWRQIAERPEYKGIPAGSLCSFAGGKWEPKDNQTRHRFGLPEIINQVVVRDAKGRFTKLK